jgi:hypothetical protein
MLHTFPASRPLITLPDFDQIAKETGFFTRDSSKMDASKFVQTLISAAVSGKASYNQIASDLGNKTGNPMSRQAMAERFENDACPSFMTAVHLRIMEAHFQPATATLKGSKIKRLVVEDSSGQAMPKSNAHDFPAHGNGHGQTAGVKIDFAYDFLSGEVLSHTLNRATEQDKTIGKETLVSIRKGDLVLRDMGYFSLSEFTYIEQLGASWLTRLPLSVGVCLENGTPLEKLLKKSAKTGVIDRIVEVGSEKTKCRLVAIRAEEKVGNRRRRTRRQEAKKKGKVPCPKGLVRDGWHIMLTNLDGEEFCANQLASIYRVRWGIEIQFRAWKQSTNLEAALNRTTRENHMIVLVLGAMIAHLLGMCIGRIYTSEIGLHRLSFEKLYDVLATHHLQARCCEDILDFRADLRHVSRDKRRREIPFTAGLVALT